MTSTDVTVEHYARPEVKAAILGYCMNGAGARALNSDERWYKGGIDPKTVMLRGPADYDATIERGRTLYATLDILEPLVFEQATIWDDTLQKPVTPIGDLSNCIAFSLSTDIDGIGDIRKDLSVKEAVEAAAQFHCDYLRKRGIEKSVYWLYSGGGIYVHLHHGLFAVDVGKTELTSEDRTREYQVLCKAYNCLIGDISQAFFREHPEHIGKVKFDRLNNQKRTFKTIFSLHKRHPYAVILLYPKAINIDFKKASLPLSDEVLAEGAEWYQTFDPSEKEPLVGLVRAHMDAVRKDTREHSTGSSTISRLPEPLDQASFAPCIKNIIEKAQPIEGKHRALGILATYLYQVGWDEDSAFNLWAEIADRCRVEPRIFETEFGRVSCPLCSTIQTDSGGYPRLNLHNLGFCVPDGHCKGCQWPGSYHSQKILNYEPTLEEIETNYKADPDSITTPGALAALRKLSPLKLAGFFPKLEINGDQKKILRGLLTPIQAPPEVEETDTIPEDIRKIAARIAERGKPLKYMLNTFHQTHKGDKLHAESQFIGFGMQSAYNTKGVFGTWDGPSGKGKSDAAKACVRQLPHEYTIISSITAKSMYHRAKDGSMLPGTVLFLDDKNIEAGSDLEETLKNIQTFFQEGAEHETLDGNGGYVKTKLPPRLLVVRTYVNSADTDGQLKNRSMDFGVDSSPKTDKEVCELVLKLGESGQTTDVFTRRTEISRALWQDIKRNAYRVIHPASSKLIEFSDVSNRRNPSLFLDMVVGLVCINHKQCDAEDGPNGEKILYSTYADYVEAARLFNSQGDYLGTRLDKAEFEAVQYIKDQGNGGGSLTGIFTHLAKKFPNDGWNTQKVRRLMDGRHDRELKGLSDSVPGIETRWEYLENGSKYKVYTIPGDLALGVRVTVHDPRTKTISSEDLSHLSRRFPIMGKEVNDSSGITTPLSYPKYPNTTKKGESTSREREEAKTGNDNILDGDTRFGKTGKTGMGNEALDVGTHLSPGGQTAGKYGKTGMGPHPRQSEPTPSKAKEDHFEDATKKPPIICAKCGESLVGSGFMEKTGPNGTAYYCTKNGCAYGKREEAQT